LLSSRYRNKQTLHGIIYVHRITDQRVGGLAKSNFHLFRKLCGDKTLKNVLIMTTMWGRLPSQEEGWRRVEQLRTLEGFVKGAIEKQAEMVHHRQDTVESAHGILRRIMKNHPMPLSIQEELVDQGKKISETYAGIALDEKLAKLAERYEQMLKEQFEAAEQARRERDEETRKEQLEESTRVRELLRRLEEEKRNLASDYQLLKDRFAETERRREEANEKISCLQESIKNLTITSNSSSPSLRHGSIVSGRSYSMFNLDHELCYATLDDAEDNREHSTLKFFVHSLTDETLVVMEPQFDLGRSRQQASNSSHKLPLGIVSLTITLQSGHSKAAVPMRSATHGQFNQ
jgi:hypothetical protein